MEFQRLLINSSIAHSLFILFFFFTMQPNSSEEAFEGPYTDMYKTLKTVGSGAFGDVKLARHKTTREKVRCLKLIHHHLEDTVHVI